MADIKKVLTDLSKEVAQLVDIARVVTSNNQGLNKKILVILFPLIMTPLLVS